MKENHTPQTLLNLSPRDAEATDKEEGNLSVWVLAVSLAGLSLLIAFMFSFYCRKWLPTCVTSCCCCSGGDEEGDSLKVKQGEKDKLIEEGHVRPPNPLIPTQRQSRKEKNEKVPSDEDSEEEKDKVKRRTLPTRPAIKVTTASGPRSRSLSPPQSQGESSSRASSPRAPAFDIVTDPSNPLLRMK